ncbi:NAD dependent epimerase/dehydratase [Colletotrichum graminicola]|uniref:NAD dependent epimerase/dehydratase n=1 Tax=Colletotrichum graminicola (strain M1.001 / M2 / FGSC 10212) TaxID=645133 RepID=E3Q8U9_COLGM|nr:NAD dependent epimerase/dehydratase [Colletotrichum graminicola M1.001]EFQ27463.1 NAD dependent epimerase/dehydratase [Colletotrichum graminicola M1.001]WDK13272.1 NAD dependent epimerase/dehydratase [Colletotrichum graminicola]
MSSTKGLALVTGANGFIGARAVEAFLLAGYSVRAAVRSQNSATSLTDVLPSYTASGQLSTAIVPDITAPGAFDDAVKGVAVIAHIASPVDFSNTDAEQVLGAAVKGTLSILDSAVGEPGLKSFVYLSSIVAVRGNGPRFEGRIVTEEDWNDDGEETLEKAGKDATGAQIYVASKVKGERALWEFRERNLGRIGFSMTAINPVWVVGPPLILPKDPKRLSDTAVVTYRVMNGEEVPPFGPGNGTHVDVRDVARLVVFAADRPDVADKQRYIAGGSENYANIQAYCDILRKAYPGRRDIIKEGEPGKGYQKDYSTPPDGRAVNGTKAVKATGQDWIPLEKMVLDAAKSYEIYF